MTCPSCGRSVPGGDFCCVCGHPLHEPAGTEPKLLRRSHHFAAAPREPAWALRVTSTLFPQLPAHDMVAFRVALLSGLGLIVLLGATGLFSVALTAAVVLIPLLAVLYLYNVDVYEDEPLLIVGLTMVLGALFGIGLGLLIQHVLTPVQQHGLSGIGTDAGVVRVILVPIGMVILALVGPLVLLRHPRFNDVLDGVIFGAASAVTLGSALTLTTGWRVTELGLQSHQDPLPWTLRLVDLGILTPLILAGAVGWAAAALWLRYRAPVKDRRAFGPLGHPVVAVSVAVVLVVVAAVVQQVLSSIGRSIVLAVLAAIGLLFARAAIHIGLMEEGNDEAPGADVVCSNCGRTTPLSTFCSRCGVALRALPKETGRGDVTPS